MRTIHLAGLSLFALAGCSATMSAGSRGETLHEYAGGIPLVFTNATPDKMCGLYMSADDVSEYGDNWLPAAGLPSGGSVELAVKPGTYKARWETCPKHGIPTFAATLWHEMAFQVDHETQLFAYVADSIPPTKRAAVLGRDHQKVMFQGQAVAAIGAQPPVVIAAAAPVAQPVATATFDDCVDDKGTSSLAKASAKGKAKATAKPALRPSLSRSHDLASKSVAYTAR